MENCDDDNGMEGDGSAYGAHQEYDDNGNYPQPLDAMSAMEPDHYGDGEDGKDDDTCTS